MAEAPTPTLEDLARRVAALEDASAAQREVNRLYGEALVLARERIEVLETSVATLGVRVDAVALPPLDLGPFPPGGSDPQTQAQFHKTLTGNMRRMIELLDRANQRLDRIERGYE